ncbi:MAG: TrmH family RNA methyltransferase [Deltaproteobacteria bacterium]|nr:TrmH family RNA methyltransferase [Deltaproteobacteria bacterium]
MINRRDRNTLLRYQKERQKNVLAKAGAHQFVLVLDRLKPGFNVPKIFRSAEAFGAAAVHLIDIGPFDPSPAKGSFRKVPAFFHDDFKTCHQQLVGEGYQFFLLSPDSNLSLCEVKLPGKSAFIFGHEEFGCRFDPGEYADIQPLNIPQFGTVQSLNVSVASSIVMFEYVRQHIQVDSSQQHP